MDIHEVIWSPTVPAIAVAILVRTALLAIITEAALVAPKRKHSLPRILCLMILGGLICACARQIEYPIAEFLYCLFHAQVSSVGFWRIREWGFWNFHTDWIAPILGLTLGVLSTVVRKSQRQKQAPVDGTSQGVNLNA